MIMARKLNTSNNFGDTKGSLETFAGTQTVYREKKDRVPKNMELPEIKNERFLSPSQRLVFNSSSYNEEDFNDPNLANVSWHK